MKGFNEQFLGVLEVNGLTPTDLKNGSRGIGSYFNKIGNGYLGSDGTQRNCRKMSGK